MEFIKLEQFKSLDEKIQKVFLNWWKPKRYDLYIDSADLSQVECLDYIKEDEEGTLYNSMRDNTSFLEDMIPLFSEGMLRRFIEDKIGCIINVSYKHKPQDGHMELEFVFYEYPSKDKYMIYISTKDIIASSILEAWWKVALGIAKEVNN